jgi:hypothetical protein
MLYIGVYCRFEGKTSLMSAAAMFLMNLLDDITFFLIERKVSLSHHSISIWEIF